MRSWHVSMEEALQRRRELNRIAAQKLRNKKKKKALSVRSEYFDAQSTHTRLQYERRQLLREKIELITQLQRHTNVCQRGIDSGIYSALLLDSNLSQTILPPSPSPQGCPMCHSAGCKYCGMDEPSDSSSDSDDMTSSGLRQLPSQCNSTVSSPYSVEQLSRSDESPPENYDTLDTRRINIPFSVTYTEDFSSHNFASKSPNKRPVNETFSKGIDYKIVKSESAIPLTVDEMVICDLSQNSPNLDFTIQRVPEISATTSQRFSAQVLTSGYKYSPQRLKSEPVESLKNQSANANIPLVVLDINEGNEID